MVIVVLVVEEGHTTPDRISERNICFRKAGRNKERANGLFSTAYQFLSGSLKPEIFLDYKNVFEIIMA